MSTIGELVIQFKLNADEVLKLQGIGPRAMTEITRLVDSVFKPPVVEVPQPEAAVEEAAAPVAEAVVMDEIPAAPVDEITAVVADVAQAQPAVEAVEAAAPEIIPVAPPVDEEEPTFDALFALRPDVIQVAAGEEESEEDGGDSKDKKKGKKKGSKRFVEITYDPDTDSTTLRKKHKRGEDGIEWE